MQLWVLQSVLLGQVCIPAYVASRIAAEKGFGNQGKLFRSNGISLLNSDSTSNSLCRYLAVANVFGSNTFNICIGLGLPWVIHIVVMGFQPYHDLENEGILESILVMSGVLAIFVAIMVSSGMQISLLASTWCTLYTLC